MPILYLFLLAHAVTAIQVSTRNGRLKGDYVRNQFGESYYAFRGIPYAQPISANFSSKDPQPIGKWNGVRDATIGRPHAANQTQGNEDCLNLTVYTRKIRRWLPPTMVQTYQASPVEVFFNGCAIDSGGNQTRSEIDNILKKDVVEVLVNHRRIASNSSGDLTDAALKDQLLALQWVKDNIHYFGGDPQKVAIFEGHSGLGDIDINRMSIQSVRA